MILIFEENETKFDSLGLGVLRDAVSCSVKEGLNDEYTLEMTYPITGSNFDKLLENRIILAKPNMDDEAQPFRIHSISRPINGVITVDAYHISYDMNGIPVSGFKAGNFLDAVNKIASSCIGDCPFKFINAHAVDKKFYKTFEFSAPTNLKALLSADEDSIGEVYDVEYKYNKWTVTLYGHRGADRGLEIRYAKNLQDVTQDTSTETLYSHVYPFYHKETTSTTSNSSDDGFPKVYIVGKKPFQDGWFSYQDGGEPFHPVDSSGVQVATEGNYKDKIYSWNENDQRYEEKIYNQSVTLIEGVTDPEWIKINWSGFPTVSCTAVKDGYFKTLTSTDGWKFHKSGEVIFDGKVTDLANISSNMIIYFSEVIPPSEVSTTSETTKVVHVELDDKLLPIDTDEAKRMKHKSVYLMDLTSEFNEEPTKEKLRDKANELIKKNKLGKLKKTTDVKFVDLRRTTDSENLKVLKDVQLGDTVKVIYTGLGINESLRVISTTYNVITNSFDNIELGEKKDKFSDNSVQNGDSISSLSNDAGYTDEDRVSQIIAETVTADYIQAQNAKLSKAQIDDLSVQRIKCTGILEATQFEIDKLVSKMLVADNAEIAQTLTAGNIKVSGDIDVKSGQINITGDDGTVFNVDREGHVTANGMTITGGSIEIQNGESNTSFLVDKDGYLTANGARIYGTIVATAGEIGGCKIIDGKLQIPDAIINGAVLSSEVISKNLKVEGANVQNLTIGRSNLDSTVTSDLDAGAANLVEERLRLAKLQGNEKVKGYIIDNEGIRSFSERYDKDTSDGKHKAGDPIDNYNSLTTEEKSGVYMSEKGIRLGELPSINPGDYDGTDYFTLDNGVKTREWLLPSGTNNEVSLTAGQKYTIYFDINSLANKPTLHVKKSDGTDLLLVNSGDSDDFNLHRSAYENKDFFGEFICPDDGKVILYYESGSESESAKICNIRIYKYIPKGFIVTSTGSIIATEGYIGGATIHNGILTIGGGNLDSDYKDSVNSSISSAQKTADDANKTSSEAKGLADSANKTATEAKSVAGEAKTAANNAETSASNADSRAASAETAAKNAETSAGNAATSASNAASNASSAATSASNAASSADDAKTSASNAEQRAKNAEGSASNAATSAKNAEGSASNAATSAKNAETSASKAEGSAKDAAANAVDGLIKSMNDSTSNAYKNIVEISNGNIRADAVSSVDIVAKKGSIGGFLIGAVKSDTDEERAETGFLISGYGTFDKNKNITYSAAGVPGSDGVAMITGYKDGIHSENSINGSGPRNWLLTLGKNFGVDKDGNLFGTNANIAGKIVSSEGEIAGLTLSNQAMYAPSTFNSINAPDTTENGAYTTNGFYIGTDGIRIGVNAKNYIDEYSANNGTTTFRFGRVNESTGQVSFGGLYENSNGHIYIANASVHGDIYPSEDGKEIAFDPDDGSICVKKISTNLASKNNTDYDFHSVILGTNDNITINLESQKYNLGKTEYNSDYVKYYNLEDFVRRTGTTSSDTKIKLNNRTYDLSKLNKIDDIDNKANSSDLRYYAHVYDSSGDKKSYIRIVYGKVKRVKDGWATVNLMNSFESTIYSVALSVTYKGLTNSNGLGGYNVNSHKLIFYTNRNVLYIGDDDDGSKYDDSIYIYYIAIGV